MHLDLCTLYYLAIATLLVSAALTWWERQARADRRRELAALAGGYLVLAVGCVLAVARAALPGVPVPAASNLLVVAGYLLLLAGVADEGRRVGARASAAVLVPLALAWAFVGTRRPDAMWLFGGSLPIALVSGASAWAVQRAPAWRSMRSRRLAAAIFAAHALWYAGRSLVLPLVVARWGRGPIAAVGQATIFEGVLYAVGLPMALLALFREEAHERLLVTSRTDFLTGLSTRQWFFEQGERLIGAVAGRPVSLLAFDLDHFKTINDRHGHATGDEVLRAFGRAARFLLPPDALLARLGGEEFVALLPGVDVAPARAAGQEVVRLFADTVRHSALGIEATVSVGLAGEAGDAVSLAGLLATADRGLYMAKALGRNRIESVAPPPIAAAA